MEGLAVWVCKGRTRPWMKRAARLYAPTADRPLWCAELCIRQGWRNRQVQQREWYESREDAVVAMKVWCHHTKPNLFPEGKRPDTGNSHPFRPSPHVPISCAVCGQEARFHQKSDNSRGGKRPCTEEPPATNGE